MGHLVNPIALRLGHTRSWEDNWFVRNLYYPEFLHSILKIRNYLYFFFTSKFMERRGILLSHFSLFKFVKLLLVKVYLYNIDLEKISNIYYYQGYNLFKLSLDRVRANITKITAIPNFYKIYNFDVFFLVYMFDRFFLKLKKKIKPINKMHIKFTLKIYYYYWNQWLLNLLKNKNDRLFIPIKFLKIFKNSNKFYINTTNSIVERLDRKIFIKKGSYVNMSFLDFFLYLFYKVRVEFFDKDKKNSEIPWKYDFIPNFFKKWKYLIKFYKGFINLNYKNSNIKNKNHFIFYANFLLYFYNLLKKKKDGRLVKLRKLTFKFVRLIFYNKFYKKFTNFYGIYISKIIGVFTKIKSTILKVTTITNSSINANFLVRYIGLKLKKKHPLFSVINPIKRELRKFSFQKKESIKLRLSKIYGNELKNNFIIKNNKNGFKYMLGLINDLYLKEFYIYYKKSKTFMTFDLFIFICLLYKKFKKIWKIFTYLKKKLHIFFFWAKKRRGIRLFKNKSIFKLNIGFVFKKLIKNSTVLKNSINILLEFFKTKLLLNLIFGVNRLNFDFMYKNFFLFSYDVKIFQILNIKFLCLIINTILNNSILLNYNSLINMESNSLSISNYFLNSFMDYMYSFYSFKNFEQYAKVNKRLLFFKIKEIYKSNSYLLGFKMSFKGRFSRKQRASSIWFNQGYVPLNTINANIEFAFFTVPIKNSAVSIKLWLYKNTSARLWNLQFLNKINYEATT